MRRDQLIKNGLMRRPCFLRGLHRNDYENAMAQAFESISKELLDLARQGLGNQIAENDSRLAESFVPTAIWDAIKDNSCDVVKGEKGSGKTALFLQLQSESGALQNGGIYLSTMRGILHDTWQAEVAAPGEEAGKAELIWRITFLRRALEHLFEKPSPPFALAMKRMARRRLRGVHKELESLFAPGALNKNWASFFDRFSHVELKGWGFGMLWRREPQRDRQWMSTAKNRTTAILGEINAALAKTGCELWVSVDSLDLDSYESEHIEREFLRAFLRTYNDFAARFDSIRLIIFVRSDIWSDVTTNSDRKISGLSHITKEDSIEWTRGLLEALLKSRLQQGLTALESQGEHLDRSIEGIFGIPFDKIFEMLQDARGIVTPRVLIHFAKEACKIQAQEVSNRSGREEPLISFSILESAAGVAARAKIEKTLIPENPRVREKIQALFNLRAIHTYRSLKHCWKCGTNDEVDAIYKTLAMLGVMKRVSPQVHRFEIPKFYQLGFRLGAGLAEEDMPVLVQVYALKNAGKLIAELGDFSCECHVLRPEEAFDDTMPELSEEENATIVVGRSVPIELAKLVIRTSLRWFPKLRYCLIGGESLNIQRYGECAVTIAAPTSLGQRCATPLGAGEFEEVLACDTREQLHNLIKTKVL